MPSTSSTAMTRATGALMKRSRSTESNPSRMPILPRIAVCAAIGTLTLSTAGCGIFHADPGPNERTTTTTIVTSTSGDARGTTTKPGETTTEPGDTTRPPVTTPRVSVTTKGGS